MPTSSSIRSRRAARAPLPRLTPEQLAVASAAELAAYQSALEMELALSSPLAFAQYVSPTAVESQPHLELLDRLIVDLVNDRLVHPKTGEVVKRLAISIPPRHGKSTLISEHTPPWFLANFPDWKIILASYEADFASSWGKKARTILEDHPEFGVPLDTTSRASGRWDLAAPNRGGMFCAGVGGPATGKGANLLIIDDPVKNSEEAQSETFRERNWDWYISTAKSRLEPRNAYTIILQTRWHEDDLMGRMLERQPDKWYAVNLPAICDDEDDPLGREVGEALCPEWYDVDSLEDIRTDEEDGRWFSALYQGQPTTKGGGIFKEDNFQYWRRSPDGTYYILGDDYVARSDCTRFATVDLAATEKTTADFSVFSVWDVTPDRSLILVGRERVKIESADHSTWLVRHFRGWKPGYVIVEKVTFGLTLIQAALRQGLPVREGKADKDKTARAIVAGTVVDAKRAWFPRTEVAPWIVEWNKELLAFPNGAHDDQVDTFAYAAKEVTTGALSTIKRKVWTSSGSPEERAANHIKRLSRKKRRGHHPELGKLY